MSTIRPLHNRVVVLPSDPSEKTPGGIIIPTTAKEKATEGKVVAVGTGRLLENGTRLRPEVEVGNTVIFNVYAGTEVDLDGVKHRVMTEDDILAVRP